MRVTELPVGTWTDDYKKYLEDLIATVPAAAAPTATDGDKKKKKKVSASTSAQVKDYTDLSTDTVVDITITFAAGVLPPLLQEKTEHGCNALEKLLKLYTTRTTTNMHVFDAEEKLVKFEKVEELIANYMQVRQAYYVKRKAYQVVALEKEARMLTNKARFITELLEDTLDLRKKKTAEVSALLKARQYDTVDDDADYKYLVRLPMDSVTEENITKIMAERDQKRAELNTLQGTTETQIWLNELAVLRTAYVKMATAAAAPATTTDSAPKKLKTTKK